MESPAKKHLVPPKKPKGRSAASPSPLAGHQTPEIKPSTSHTRKKNIPKLPKKSAAKELSPTPQEKDVSPNKLPNNAKVGTPDVVNADDLEYKEPLPIRETVEVHQEMVEDPEEVQEVVDTPSQEQRKFETKRAAASGSGGGLFQRGKNAASRISDFTGTVRDLGSRATTAASGGTFDNIQNGISGVSKRVQPAEGRIASTVTEEISTLPTDISSLTGLELNEEGNVLDNDGNAVGTLVEGDPSDLSGQVVGENGEILDEDGDLIGRVELVRDETAKQADEIEEAVGTDTLPSLQDMADLPLAEDGLVRDEDGRALGQLVEGDPDDLVGRIVDQNGDILDEDGDLIGRVEPIAPGQVEESTSEAEPTDGVPLPEAATQELEEQGSPSEQKEEFTDGEPGEKDDDDDDEVEEREGEGEEEDADGNKPEIPEELPDISTLEGLKCNKFGKIIGEDGIPVGELISGNAREISKRELQLDDHGQFWDNRGNILGKAQTIPIKEEDQRLFSGFEDLVVVQDGWVEDTTGTRVGQIVDGEIKKLIGRAVDDDGDVLDKRGNLIGHAEPWEEEPEPEPEQVDFSSVEGLSPTKLGFVIGPDGALLGRVTEGDLKKVAGKEIDDEGQIWGDDGKVIGRVELVPEEEREVPGPFSDLGELVVRQDGLVETEEGDVVGKIIEGDPKKLRGKAVDDDGEILDKHGNVLGRAEPYTPSEPSEEPEEDLSELEGMTVNKFGNVVDESGAVFGRLVSGDPKKLNGTKVDGEGQIWSDDGKVLGNVELIPAAEREQSEGVFYGLDDLTVARDGTVITPEKEVVGRLTDGEPKRLAGRAVDEDGEIVDKVGNVIGRAERWTPEEKERDINPMSGRKVNKDGMVRDIDGNLIGRLTMGNLKAMIGKVVNDNGNIVDNDGNIIGECTLEENLPDEEVEPEPEISPEEAEQQAKEQHDRELAKKISTVIQQTLDSVEPLCKRITEVILPRAI